MVSGYLFFFPDGGGKVDTVCGAVANGAEKGAHLRAPEASG